MTVLNRQGGWNAWPRYAVPLWIEAAPSSRTRFIPAETSLSRWAASWRNTF